MTRLAATQSEVAAIDVAFGYGLGRQPHGGERVWSTQGNANAIPVDLRQVDIGPALNLAVQFGTYAYDAYFLECALRLGGPLLTLDKGMKHIARQLNIELLEDSS